MVDGKREELRKNLMKGLENLGFKFADNRVSSPNYPDKESIRTIYTAQRQKILAERAIWLERIEKRALPYFASGDEISPTDIEPRLEMVKSPLQVDIFRYACLLWSIPVSPGYGRRIAATASKKAMAGRDKEAGR